MWDLNIHIFPFRYTKPLTFADCISDELPLGWEEAYDPQVGVYYIDHNTRKCDVILHNYVKTFNLYNVSYLQICLNFSFQIYLHSVYVWHS